jgi:hypothetical protein
LPSPSKSVGVGPMWDPVDFVRPGAVLGFSECGLISDAIKRCVLRRLQADGSGKTADLTAPIFARKRPAGS